MFWALVLLLKSFIKASIKTSAIPSFGDIYRLPLRECRRYGIISCGNRGRCTPTFRNGSALSKNLSANFFNDWWNQQAVGQRQEAEKTNAQNQSSTTGNTVEKEEAHALFNFLNKEQPTDDLWIDGLGGLLPEAQGEVYEEQEFANRMKKKKKRKRHGRQQ
ncbi:hypothetical protein LKO28_13975 [Sphingobacterium sp. FBM7-1]|nr:hypothetical protein [Sphingobacterium sp. FBM7-1]MCC2600584.1 hypothetical protein [Sphingobacterium sp. FBM7-1]